MNRTYLAIKQLQDYAESTANRGVADGYATLDATGNVPLDELGNVVGMEVHDITGAYHSATGLTAGHFMKALSPTTFGFEAHGLTAADVSALALAGGVMAGTIDMAAYQLYLNTPGTYPYSYIKGIDGDVYVNGNTNLRLGLGTDLKMLIASALTTMYQNVAMNDNSITGIDTLTFTDVNGTIAGIENQNLVDKSAAETISGLWSFGTFPVTPSSAPTTSYQVANKAYADLMIPLTQKDSASGVVAIDGSGHIIGPASNLQLTRDGSNIVRIQDRTSAENMIWFQRNGATDVDAYIPVGGTNRQVLTSADIGSTGLVGSPLPAGVFMPYGGSSAPSGWLLCNGAAVSRTTYAALYSAIGTAYGVGNGSTTFNVPNMQGNVPVGIGASGVASLGATGGEQEHTLTVTEMPAHTHSYSGDNYGSGAYSPYNYPLMASSADVSRSVNSAGGGGAHNNMQPYVGVNYIIKY